MSRTISLVKNNATLKYIYRRIKYTAKTKNYTVIYDG